jgi:predicted esterase
MRRLLLILCIATRAAAGELMENVATRADPTQTYTLLLPRGYDADKKHPLLYVFDPRSRGRMAAEIFRGAADEYGWIVISSNQTRSDDDGAANDRAVRALLPEATRYATDPRRIYAAGFSGTAMLSWAIGIKSGLLAGVIGVGGRVIPEAPPAKFSFAHYGFAGDTDFNNRDMRIVDAQLEREGKAHRFRQFTADHRWIGPDLAREAIEWMEVMAMKEERRARDAALIAAIYERDLAGARAMSGAGALRRYREIVRTFEGLHPLGDAKSAVTRLESDPAVKREWKEIASWDAFEERYLSEAVNAFREPDLAHALRIPELQRRAKRDGIEGITARRILETVYTQTAFYLKRDLMQKREFERAAAILSVAVTIHPDRWPAWYNLGAAQARAGHRRKALESLEKAVASGFADRAMLLADEDFASLRGDPRFQALLASHSQ